MADRFDKLAAQHTTPRATLATAIEEVEMARRCIAENGRREDKDMAREGYEAAVTEILVPAITNAVEDIQTPRSLESIAKFVLKKMEKEN